jgi:hypothetical protein
MACQLWWVIAMSQKEEAVGWCGKSVYLMFCGPSKVAKIYNTITQSDSC